MAAACRRVAGGFVMPFSVFYIYMQSQMSKMASISKLLCSVRNKLEQPGGRLTNDTKGRC